MELQGGAGRTEKAMMGGTPSGAGWTEKVGWVVFLFFFQSSFPPHSQRTYLDTLVAMLVSTHCFTVRLGCPYAAHFFDLII